MRMADRLTLLIVCFIIMITGGNAIKCYECRSNQGQCNEGSCSLDGGMCVKKEKKFENGTWTVVKSCIGAFVFNRTCVYDQSIGLDGQICYCSNGDFCNAAPHSPYSQWTTILVSISLAILHPFMRDN